VTFSNLLTRISVGGVLALVGAIIVGAGVGLGIHELFPALPLSICLLFVGLLLGGVGAGLVIYGTEKAEEKVEKTLTVEHQVNKHPMMATVIAVLAGVALYRLFLGGRRDRRPAAPSSVEETRASSDGAPEVKKKSGVLSFLTDQMGDLGVMARDAALAMGLQALGMPALEQLKKTAFEAMGLEEKPPRSRHQGKKRSHRPHNGQFQRNN